MRSLEARSPDSRSSQFPFSFPSANGSLLLQLTSQDRVGPSLSLRTWMVNLGRRTIAGLQINSQRLIAAAMAEPRTSLFMLWRPLFLSFIVFLIGMLEP